MKVIKEDKKTRGVTLRLDESIMERIDKVAQEYQVSRTRLIEAILDQALSDKAFVLKIKG